MKIRILTAIAVAAAIVVPATVHVSRSVAQRSLSQVESEAANARAKEQVLTSQITTYNDRIRAVEARLAPIEAKLTALQTELTGLRTERQRLTAEIEEQQRKLIALLERLKRQQEELSGRLSASYRSPDPTMLQVLLETTSVTAALAAQQGMERTVGRDRQLIHGTQVDAAETEDLRDRIRVARKKVWENEKRVAEAEAEVRVVFNEVDGERRTLVSAKQARTTLLSNVQHDRRELEAEAKDLRARSAALAQQIQSSSVGLPATVQVGGSGRFAWPVSGPVVSGFGWRWGRMHEGIDIAVGTGVPIGASGPGTVIVAGWTGGYGNLVVVGHGGGLSTAYAHMSAVNVSVGQQVSTGTTLGAVGCTGHCYGPHVHFEVRINGAATNPINYL